MNVNTEIKKLSRNFVVNTNLIRKENGLSYRGLARVADISDSTVRRIDTVRRTRNRSYVPSLGTVVKMAQAVGVQPAELLASY
jgi:transcriptional regulator with XRE-family HTH domain